MEEKENLYKYFDSEGGWPVEQVSKCCSGLALVLHPWKLLKLVRLLFQRNAPIQIVLIQVNPAISDPQVRQVVGILHFWADEVWRCHSSLSQSC